MPRAAPLPPPAQWEPGLLTLPPGVISDQLNVRAEWDHIKSKLADSVRVEERVRAIIASFEGTEDEIMISMVLRHVRSSTRLATMRRRPSQRLPPARSLTHRAAVPPSAVESLRAKQGPLSSGAVPFACDPDRRRALYGVDALRAGNFGGGAQGDLVREKPQKKVRRMSSSFMVPCDGGWWMVSILPNLWMEPRPVDWQRTHGLAPTAHLAYARSTKHGNLAQC